MPSSARFSCTHSSLYLRTWSVSLSATSASTMLLSLRSIRLSSDSQWSCASRNSCFTDARPVHTSSAPETSGCSVTCCTRASLGPCSTCVWRERSTRSSSSRCAAKAARCDCISRSRSTSTAEARSSSRHLASSALGTMPSSRCFIRASSVLDDTTSPRACSSSDRGTILSTCRFWRDSSSDLTLSSPCSCTTSALDTIPSSSVCNLATCSDAHLKSAWTASRLDLGTMTSMAPVSLRISPRAT
mmetsp:Transcript_21883/g.59921  ORF Transcript_21883/g.59921 Transcript_21883/m.59921 type:complete len:244 (+) Transcript_21883:252-983(+)